MNAMKPAIRRLGPNGFQVLLGKSHSIGVYTYSCMTIPLEFEQVLDFSLIFIYFRWFYCLLILKKCFDIEYESFLEKHQKRMDAKTFENDQPFFRRCVCFHSLDSTHSILYNFSIDG